IDQHPARVEVLSIGERNADRNAATAGKAVEIDRLAQFSDNPLGELADVLGVTIFPHQDDEFIAADARYGVTLPDIAGQDPGRMDEHGVAGRMSERIVDL